MEQSKKDKAYGYLLLLVTNKKKKLCFEEKNPSASKYCQSKKLKKEIVMENK